MYTLEDGHFSSESVYFQEIYIARMMYWDEIYSGQEYKEKVLEVIEVEQEELTLKAYQDLQKIAPFGEGNTMPLFILKNYDCRNMNKSRDGKHVLLKINDEANLTGFNMVKDLKETCTVYDLIFNLESNDLYNNKITCNCKKMEVN